MKYVIIRDDDANGLTSPDQLEELYRPFLARGMPVQLAVIPAVRTDARTQGGDLEGFLEGPAAGRSGVCPVAENTDLTSYLRSESGYGIVQHGLHHAHCEFATDDQRAICRMLDEGTRHLRDAGFLPPDTFVAPQDVLSRAAVRELRERFSVISAGYYDLSRIPRRLWPRYLWQKKALQRSHFTLGRQLYLTHPGCILSYNRAPEPMLAELDALVSRSRLLVVVSHHWEYFAGGARNQGLIDVLHGFAERLADRRDVRVIHFRDAQEALR